VRPVRREAGQHPDASTSARGWSVG